jgi:putative ABC transport system substrate-binding protein
MDRRTFVGTVGRGMLVACSTALAQTTHVYRVAFLLGATRESVAPLFGALREGMRELGYVEGRNVVFEQRYGEGKVDRLPELAAELVRLKPDVIVTGTNLHVEAVRHATDSIPVVMVFTFDPVGSGFVRSLARPGGNITGLSADSSSELWAKYLALLQEMVPNLSRVGVIGQTSAQVGFTELAQASRQLGLTLDVANLRTPEDFDREFSNLVAKRVQALLIVIGPLTYLLKERIADAAIRRGLPAITNAVEFAQAGILMSYGPYIPDLYRHAAVYVDKVLHGVSPAVLPIEQPAKLQLIVNLKTAKALGVRVPQSLLLRADEVIE